MPQQNSSDKHQYMSLGEAIMIMPDEDLEYIAAYNPPMMKNMCLFLSLEIQLRKEGKLPQIEDTTQKTWIPENLFVYSWRKIKKWLFLRFTMTERRKR